MTSKFAAVEQLSVLSVALGLACLAGLNLYLTVFATGLAIHLHWISLGQQYQSLNALGDPIVITIAGVLFALEFFADKIPWFDSAWDAVHTIIRPIGGALLAIQTLGHTSPTFDVAVALLAGTTALAAHTAKATTRLISNSSPEPFSNIALSVGEDVAVLGGLALLHAHPVVALAVFIFALCAFVWFAPRVLRAARVKLWLVWRKLNEPALFLRRETALPITLPPKLAPVFARENILGETIAWALPCVCARGKRVPPNTFGALVATNEDPRKLTFIGQKGRRAIAQVIDLNDMTITREPRFLSENLVISPRRGGSAKFLFLFPRSSAADVEKISEALRETPGPTRAAATEVVA